MVEYYVVLCRLALHSVALGSGTRLPKPIIIIVNYPRLCSIVDSNSVFEGGCNVVDDVDITNSSKLPQHREFVRYSVEKFISIEPADYIKVPINTRKKES